MAHPFTLHTLDRAECLRLLQTVPVVRIVFTESALPAVQPVSAGPPRLPLGQGQRRQARAIHPWRNVDPAARGHVHQLFQACAVQVHLVRQTGLARDGQVALDRLDLCPQLEHDRYLLPQPSGILYICTLELLQLGPGAIRAMHRGGSHPVAGGCYPGWPAKNSASPDGGVAGTDVVGDGVADDLTGVQVCEPSSLHRLACGKQGDNRRRCSRGGVRRWCARYAHGGAEGQASEKASRAWGW